MPLLVLVFAVAQKRAQATSLVVVALAALSGAVTYSVGASVVWEAVVFLLAGGLLGTWIGSALMVKARSRWLQLAFSVVMVAVAIRLVVTSLSQASVDIPDLEWTIMIGYGVAGLAMGLLSALLGIGGGIIVVPLLVTFFGFSQQLAQGTSLVVMVPIALLGAWRQTRSGFTQWAQGLRVGGAAAVGSVAGASIALVLASQVLQIGFAVVLVGAAAQMAWKARR